MKTDRIKTLIPAIGLLILAALLPVRFLQADGRERKLSFHITNDFLYQSNKLADETNQFYENLTLFANYGQWSLGLTLRGNNFFKQTPNVSLDNIEFDVYRKYIQYNSRDLKVTLGDFYSLLGRGLVLSVLQNDTILRERTILGGDVRYNKGRFDFRALGGQVKDETEDQEWTIAGGEAAVEYTKNHSAGVHFSYIEDIDTHKRLGNRLTYSFSMKGVKLFKYISYYTEAAFLQFRQRALENGHAIYSNVTYNRSHVTLSLEFKKYKNFDNEMNNPPIGDREDEIPIVGDTTGIRANFQYAFWEPDIILFFNIGRYEEFRHTGNNIYGGVIIEDLMDRLSLNLTYGVRDILYPIKRLDGNLIYQFDDHWSTEFTYYDKRYIDGNFTFTETDHTVQVSYSPYVSLFFMHQYSHNKIIGLNHFYSGGIKVYLPGGTAVELSGGSIRGGLICSGGQCYLAPPFKGVKLAVLHTFK
ncbi:MAG: hypothetical protein GY940_27920 [bacterium]|nr:hypothetical protein [bacterium]